MKQTNRAMLVAAVVLAVTSADAARFGQADAPQNPAPPQDLPPLTYVCPMPQDNVSEDQPGKCPICGMTLTPVRLDLAWSCPVHPAVIAGQPGACPIDGRDLVEVTVAIHWECGGVPGQHFTEPGKCSDGADRTIVRERRVHGDHNPRHGGIFFMAADQWHHLEGTHPDKGVFRLYLYDNFTRPKPVQGLKGRVAVLDDSFAEVATVPLGVSGDGQTLEARIETDRLPLRLAALVDLDSKLPEQRFDFLFPDYSREPVAASEAAAVPSGAMTAIATTTPFGSGIEMRGSVPRLTKDNLLSLLRITEPVAMAQALPDTRPELLELLDLSDRQVRDAVERGQWSLVYNPAMLGKDIALALERSAGDLPADQRAQAADAVRDVVLAAWHLDLWGDTGNGPKVRETYAQFTAAVGDVKAAFGAKN